MSPNTLLPSQPYTLSYFITDHTDVSTYYVRAVVYDATTGEVLDTQNLTPLSTNPHLFTKRAQAPGDSTGRGRRIVVVATPYTDSGYTTKAENYQEQSENYIVIKQDGVLGGGGGYIDYNIIKEIFDKALDPVTKTVTGIQKLLTKVSEAVAKIPTEKVTVEMQPLYDALIELERQISLIPTEKVDLEPVVVRIGEAIKAIEDKEVTEKTDLTPVTDALSSLEEKVGTQHEENMTKMTPLVESIAENIPKLLKKSIAEAVGKQKFTLVPMGLEVQGKAEDTTEEKKPQSEAPNIDIRTLTGQK